MIAPVAQWIEQLGSNESVGGSSPSGSTSLVISLHYNLCFKINILDCDSQCHIARFHHLLLYKRLVYLQLVKMNES